MFKCDRCGKRHTYKPSTCEFCGKYFEENSKTVECDGCGKLILSDKPTKCPFCSKIFGNKYYPSEQKYCPTCHAPIDGNECFHCGDEVLR